MSELVGVITAGDAATRDKPIEAICHGLPLSALLEETIELDRFRQ